MEKLNKFTKFFRKIYYQVCIENFKDKLIYNFPQNYHRWDLIDYLIKKNDYSNYLEIGCDKDQSFSKINSVFDSPFTSLDGQFAWSTKL